MKVRLGLLILALLGAISLTETPSAAHAQDWHLPWNESAHQQGPPPTPWADITGSPFHNGDAGEAWDFNGPSNQECGKNTTAARDGQVFRTSCNDELSAIGYGCYARIRHNNNAFKSHHAHMAKLFVTKYQTVCRGQLVGVIGNTDGNTGDDSEMPCHLHFHITQEGRDSNNVRIYTPLNPKFRRRPFASPSEPCELSLLPSDVFEIISCNTNCTNGGPQ